jgi:hypothetical protein
MDLSSNKPELYEHTEYCQISYIEDRLFVNKEFVPLFEEKGTFYHFFWLH